jgi:hypothetical protein
VSQVDIVLHYRYGSEMRLATIGNVHRSDAEKFINTIGKLLAADGIVSISGQNGIQGMIPAKGIDLAEIKERP